MLERVQSNRSAIHWRMQNGTAPLDDRLAIPYTTNNCIPTTQSSNHTSWYLPKGVDNVHTQTGPRMSTAALFVISQTWKQPRCPSIGISRL